VLYRYVRLDRIDMKQANAPVRPVRCRERFGLYKEEKTKATNGVFRQTVPGAA